MRRVKKFVPADFHFRYCAFVAVDCCEKCSISRKTFPKPGKRERKQGKQNRSEKSFVAAKNCTTQKVLLLTMTMYERHYARSKKRVDGKHPNALNPRDFVTRSRVFTFSPAFHRSDGNNNTTMLHGATSPSAHNPTQQRKHPRSGCKEVARSGHFLPSNRFADVDIRFLGRTLPCFRLCEKISVNSVEFFVLVGRRFLAPVRD